MVARLLVDALWRSRWMYVSASVTYVGASVILPRDSHLLGDSWINALPINLTAVISLVLVSMAGPLLAVATMGLRALRHLAVTSRDLWRTTWILATVVPAGVLLGSKLISVLVLTAFRGNPNVSVEAMLLSTVYDFAWACATLTVAPFVVYEDPRVDSRGRLAASLVEGGRFVGMLACFGLPIHLSAALPTAVSEFTPLALGVLAACLAIAFGTLAWTPRRGLLAGERARGRRAGRTAGPDAATTRRVADRLTGIPRVAVPYLLTTLAWPVGGCLALAAYGVVTGLGPWWFIPRTPSVFDPADIGDRGLTYFVLLPSALVVMHGAWNPWARLLKVLPLSVRQLNALLLLTPFAAWTTFWVLGWSAYSFAYGAPQTLRVEFALSMAALSALGHAVLLRIQGGAAMIWILAFIGGLLPQLVKIGLHDGTTAHLTFAAIGVFAFCVAAFVNHRTLTRSTSSSRAYQPIQRFGLPAPRRFGV